MKTIFGSRKDHYLIRVSILLIMAALVTGMAGCFILHLPKTWKYGLGMICRPSGTTWLATTL